MKTQECTLQEAVELCKNSGGFIYPEDDPNNNCRKYRRQDLMNPTLDIFSGQDFARKWIYEPPLSAFQEWDSRKPTIKPTNSSPDSLVRGGRKEGWNAAINAVLKMSRKSTGFLIIPDQVKELKES